MSLGTCLVTLNLNLTKVARIENIKCTPRQFLKL
jgi:hypothetical protein